MGIGVPVPTPLKERLEDLVNDPQEAYAYRPAAVRQLAREALDELKRLEEYEWMYNDLAK
jgi:ribosome recycling factor